LQTSSRHTFPLHHRNSFLGRHHVRTRFICPEQHFPWCFFPECLAPPLSPSFKRASLCRARVPICNHFFSFVRPFIKFRLVPGSRIESLLIFPSRCGRIDFPSFPRTILWTPCFLCLILKRPQMKVCPQGSPLCTFVSDIHLSFSCFSIFFGAYTGTTFGTFFFCGIFSAVLTLFGLPLGFFFFPHFFSGVEPRCPWGRAFCINFSFLRPLDIC